MSVSMRTWSESTLVMLLHEMAFKWADGCPKIYAHLLKDLLTSNGLPSLTIPQSLIQLRDGGINTSINCDPGPQMPCNENIIEVQLNNEPGLDMSCDDNKPEEEIQHETVPLPNCTGNISESDIVQEAETRFGVRRCTLNQFRVRHEADPALPHTEAGIWTVSDSSPSSSELDDYSDSDTSNNDSGRSSPTDQEQHNEVPSREDIERRTLSQDYLTSIVNFPDFDKAVIGYFVRIYVKNEESNIRTRIVAEITDVVECPILYEINDITTNKTLKLRHGTYNLDYLFSLRWVSNLPLTEGEHNDWVEDCLFY